MGEILNRRERAIWMAAGADTHVWERYGQYHMSEHMPPYPGWVLDWKNPALPDQIRATAEEPQNG